MGKNTDCELVTGSGEICGETPKKKLCWHTTYGEIEVVEQTYRDRSRRLVIRPFAASARVSHRSYSLPIQEVITDFGAEEPFARVAKKVMRHYGIGIGDSAAYTITSAHAAAVAEAGILPEAREEADALIVEADGSMIPVVYMEATEEETDLRKTRKLAWKEIKLAMAWCVDGIEPLFGVTVGHASEAGPIMLKVAKAAGLTPSTKVHALGDGAGWLRDQVECQFGTQATYLVDFYHGCKYLAAAAKTCCPDNSDAWTTEQKTLLKINQVETVLAALEPHIEADNIRDDDAPVRKCRRYFGNRLDQLDYKGALANGLPIASGAIESAHIYIVQKRIKTAGAWWKPKNAENIVALRIADINGVWDDYWDTLK